MLSLRFIMNTSKTVAFHTLGCKLNFAETSTLARQFELGGYSKTKFEDAADVYVINTCSVTEDANRECRRIVRGALRNSPEAFVVITGCYAQLKPDEIATMEGVDLVIGASEKFNVLNFIKEGKKKAKAEIHSCAIEEIDSFNSAFSSDDRTRSFLKVQDGCDYTCTYCTIPMARGVSRSDSIENVVYNAEKLAAQGVKEIILTGVNIGDFISKEEGRGQKAEGEGKKAEGEEKEDGKREKEEGKQPLGFLDLIKKLDVINFDVRFRISSIEPNLLTDEIIEFVATSKKFVPHFHIPLQSGSDKILGLMKRRYKSKLYKDRVEKIKSLMPNCCIGVDVIIGFPSETEGGFLETFNFIDSLDVSYLHVFTYSERDNTEAILIKPVVPIEERKKRNRVLRNLSAVKQANFYAQNIGLTKTVLFEKENKEGFMYGFTENYIKVKAVFDPVAINKPIQLKLVELNNDNTVSSNFDELVNRE